MKITMKKILALGLFITLSMFVFANITNAYVNVKGYYRKDGTYVSPHVRSNPNGLKYDNYSWTQSQGLYNETYGTRGAEWDTPTYVTDPDYYTGQQLYQSGSSGYIATPTHSSSSNNIQVNTTKVPVNATASQYGGWYCNNGYKKNYSTSQCDKVIIPPNASLNYFGDDWVCNSGYKKNYQTNNCNKVIIPTNAQLNYFGDGWVCNSGYKKNYSTNQCDRVIIPENASLNYFGDDWICNRGYKKNYNTSQCSKVIIPQNATLDYFGNDFVCNNGYTRNYLKSTCDLSR